MARAGARDRQTPAAEKPGVHRARLRVVPSGAAAKPVEVVIRVDDVDPAWDAFVASMPGASYLQTSLWSRVKGAAGLEVARVILQREGAPVAGCQMLIRRTPVMGSVGYVPLGPVVPPEEPQLAATVLDALDHAARRLGVSFLKLQPAAAPPPIEQALADAGYAPSDLSVAPTCTVHIPVAGRSDEELLGAMRASTRGNMRRGERSAVRIESVGAAGLPILQEHLETTAARQGFTPYSAAYHRHLWNTFASDAEVRLLVAEDEGVPLASALLVGFGDTVMHKVGGWSGKPSKVRPNELIHWHAMRWARDAGYASYDLGGISADRVRALSEDPDAARKDPANGVAFFKLGLGGEVVEGPGAFDRAMPSLRGRAIAALVPHLQRRRATIARLAGRAR